MDLNARYGTGVDTTRFYYDDQWRVIAEYDGNDSLVAKYVYGPEIDEPLQMARNGTNYYYHAAALGTVTEITLADETIVERYMYDVYGTPKMWDGSGNLLTDSAIGNRFLFQGRDRDPDSGLYNFRNRYYSPTLGRFVQVDPIREESGLNLFLFVRNNPVNHTDAHGLVTQDDLEELKKEIELIRRMRDLANQMIKNLKNCKPACWGISSAVAYYCNCFRDFGKNCDDFATCICIQLPQDDACKKRAKKACKAAKWVLDVLEAAEDED